MYNKTNITLVILILLLAISSSQIYPEKLSTWDSIIISNQNSLFLVQAVYYTTSTTTSFYLNRQGIVVKPSQDYGPPISENIIYSSNDLVVQNIAITSGSDEVSLYKNSITNNSNGNGIVLKIPMNQIQNSSYKFTLVVPIFNTSIGTQTLSILGWNGSNYSVNLIPSPITPPTFPPNSVIKISLMISGNTSTSVIVSYSGSNQIVTLNAGFLSILFSFGYNGNDLKITYSYLLLDIGTTSIYSIYGTNTCNVVLNDCVEGYSCIGSSCKKCFPGCSKCTIDISSSSAQSSCTLCQKNTKEWNTGGTSNGYLEYTDISQFKNLNFNFEPPRTNRVTLSFWTYVSDLSKMKSSNQMVNFVLGNHFVVSVEASSTSDVKLMCTMYEKLYRIYGIGTQTNSASLMTIINQNNIPYNNIVISNVDAKWFYTRCAMSFDQAVFYLLGSADGIIINVPGNETALPIETLYTTPTISNDVFFKTNYRNGDTISFTISNASSTFTQFFLKNIYIFREYIPYNMNFQYFDLHNPNVIGNGLDWPELLFSLPLDNLTIGTSYNINYNVFSYTGATISNTYSLSLITGGSLYTPSNFKRLNTLKTKNTKYNQADLSSSTNLNLLTGQMLNFDDNLSFTCQNSFFLNLNNFTCNSDCPIISGVKYTMYPGTSNSKGYCNYKCSSAINCPYTNADLQNLKNKFTCTSSSYIKAFYTCPSFLNNNKFALYFNSFFTPSNINIAPASIVGLKSYIIEIWYYPDNFVPKNIYNVAPGNNVNYIFFSNSARIYYKSSTNSYYLETPFSTTTTSNISNYEWNKLIFHIQYDNLSSYSINFYNKNIISSPVNMGSSTINQSLQYIIFCHLDSGNCLSNTNIYWSSGFYSNLRVWNGDYTSPWVISQYDQYFNYSNLNYRTASIVLHYPMNLSNLADNIFRDPANPTNNIDMNLKNSWNNDYLQIFNYSSAFDNIVSSNKLGYFISAYTGRSASFNVCPSACQRCWSNSINDCYVCSNSYFLIESTCLSSASVPSYYFFKVPTDNKATVTFQSFSGISPAGTITFYIKLFGFTINPADLIFYSSNLKLNYDTATYGLSLIGNGNTIGTYSNFRNYFGVWCFISLAYYYNSLITSRYPAMMNFIVDNNNITLNTAFINNLFIDQFKIPNTTIALFSSLKVYNTYLVGAYGYELNSFSNFPTINPIYVLMAPSTNSAGCFVVSTALGFTDSYTCVSDYNQYFDNSSCFCNNALTYFINTSSTCSQINNCQTCNVSSLNSCQETCYYNRTANGILLNCSCRINNAKTSMILSNGGANICYKFDYIDFSLINTITFSNNIRTAQGANQYTLQFWVFAYNYTGTTNFQGMEVIWNLHSNIKIIYTGSNWEYRCWPIYDISNPSKYTESSALSFNINSWNFVSCAVNLSGATGYYYVSSDGKLNPSGIIVPAVPLWPTLGSTTTLIINDLSTLDYGVLFIRQFRLWNNCYPNVIFLSRVNIVNGTLFPNLLHIFDPLFPASGILQFKEGSTGLLSQNISYKNNIGTNVVDSALYSTLSLCSESGQYYDFTTGVCLQFVDLSKIPTFSLSNIPSAYHGRYTLEFWIFTEDISDVTSGVNILWTNHLDITVMKTPSGTLGAYCFPQAYKIPSLLGASGNSILNLFNSATNASKVDLTINNGVWMWVRCSVSTNLSKYYISYVPIAGIVNSASNPVLFADLAPEVLYNNTSNDYPFKFFFFNAQLSNVLVQGISSQTKKIFLRNIYAFNDYLPHTYNFQYMDLTKISAGTFSSLVLACNFSNYNLSNDKLSYTVQNNNLLTTYTVVLTIGSPLSLAANFSPLSLCDPSAGLTFQSSTQTCVSIINCIKSSLNANYCYADNSPLSCLNNFYYDSSISPPQCSASCTNNSPRSPGSNYINAICNYICTNTSSCPNTSVSQMKNFQSNYLCQNGYVRINYQCVKSTNAANGALFFSRCFNTPNMYYNFVSIPGMIQNGHILEIWFKLDNVYNNCNYSTSSNRAYYLYTVPHTIYVDLNTNIFYYENSTKAYNKSMPSIQRYEWNVILFKTEILLNVQNLSVYVNYNFNNPEIYIPNIPTSINMSLASIAYCSNNISGICQPQGTSIQIDWGSAYYKNIRIWDLSSSTQWLVQAYNNIFNETIKSLVAFYPLNLYNMDLNIWTNIAGNYDHINYSSIYVNPTNTMASYDQDILFNYSTTYDYNSANPGMYIASMSGTNLTASSCSSMCKNCYSNSSNNCYTCQAGNALVGQSCVNRTNYYLKVPVGQPNTPVSLRVIDTSNNFDITQLDAMTLTFWTKFFGVISSSVSAQPIILSLSPNTFFAFEISSKNLIFNQNNQNAFRDKNFSSSIGNWILITFSNYISGALSSTFPNMVTVSSNKIDLTILSTYKMPSSGIVVQQLQLGYEIVALFAQFRIYSKFIHGAYGWIMTTPITKGNGLYLLRLLEGNSSNNCISNEDISGATTNSLLVTCISDYNSYLDPTLQCNNDKNYFDLSIAGVTPPCGVCDSNCYQYCYDSSPKSCSCDLSSGLYWLNKDPITTLTYCNLITNVDFSSYQIITINGIKKSSTMEYTIEFWIYVYAYNSGKIIFSSFDVSWNYHNRVNVYNINNSLIANCFSLSDLSNKSRYSENINQSLTLFKWNNIRCGTNHLTKHFFLNTVQLPLQTTDIPNYNLLGNVQLQIGSPNSAAGNFGFVFMRMLKLWQSYNFKYIDTSYINILPSMYSGLLHLFPNNYNNSSLIDTVTWMTYNLTRRLDFIGYNIVDPLNTVNYKDIPLCPQGQIYDLIKLVCVVPGITKCQYPANANDDCILCPDSQPFLHQLDGNCYVNCPPPYFGQTMIKECRICHSSCYTCYNIFENNCTSCIGNLYFHKNLSMCVSNCEKYGLTKSISVNNVCTIFDAVAALIIINPSKIIDPFTFTALNATIVDATSSNFTTNWFLNFSETYLINKGNITLDSKGPFISNTNSLYVKLNPNFFQLGKKYNFGLNITSINQNSTVTVQQNWTFVMNNAPENGTILSVPRIGYRLTTLFTFSCLGWLDDTSSTLQYQIYYIEENTGGNRIFIKNYTNPDQNYISYIFDVRYYKLTSTTISVYCDIKDNYGAVNSTFTNITIINDVNSNLFSLNDALKDFTIENIISFDKILVKAQYLNSLANNIFNDIHIKENSVISPSLDGTTLSITDPECREEFCNSRGQCYLIDLKLACYCNIGYVGSNCQIEKTGYNALYSSFKNLYNYILSSITSTLNFKQIQAIEALFVGASKFNQNTSFLYEAYDFMTLVYNSYPDTIIPFYNNYLNIFNAIIYYIHLEIAQYRTQIKNNTAYEFRNISISISQQNKFKIYFDDFSKEFLQFIDVLTEKLGVSSNITVNYTSDNMYLSIVKVNPQFNASSFFSSRKANYEPFVDVMYCLNEIEINKLNNPYYSAWVTYIHWKNNPFIYNDTIYSISTSPFHEVFIFDSLTNKPVLINNCTKGIIHYFPIQTIGYLNYINIKKNLYFPNNEYGQNNPIFSNPIYVYPNGTITNDTVEERIKQFYREWNFSCNYYDPNTNSFDTNGMGYINLTDNYIVCNSSHLTGFMTTFVKNNGTFNIDGRFFYLKHYYVFFLWGNYINNYAYFSILVVLSYYLVVVSITTFYDMKYFRQEVLLDFLKEEIIRVQMPYTDKIKFPHKDRNPFSAIVFPNQQEIENQFGDVNFDIHKNNRIKQKEDLPEVIFISENKFTDENGIKIPENIQEEEENKDFDNEIPKIEDPLALFDKKVNSQTTKNNEIIQKDYESPKTIPSEERLCTQSQSDKPFSKTKKRLIRNNYINSAEIQLNDRPKTPPPAEENEEDENHKRIEELQMLNLTFAEFFCRNIIQRHIIISPLFSPSVFNPRYKKLTIFVTQTATIMFLLSVLLTYDSTKILYVYDSLSSLIGLALLSSFGSNMIVLFLIYPFRLSSEINNELYIHVVNNGPQLGILKKWEDIKSINSVKTLLGIALNIVYWLICFYFTFIFVAVWKIQSYTWLIGFISSLIIEFIGMEIAIEFLISLLFAFRRNYHIATVLADYLIRYRNYRTLWP